MFDPIWSNISQYESWQAWNTSRNMPNFDVAMATCSVAVSLLFSHILLCIYVLSIFFHFLLSGIQSPESRVQSPESSLARAFSYLWESITDRPLSFLLIAITIALQNERFAVDLPQYYLEGKNVKSDGRFLTTEKKNQCVEYI